MTVRKLVNGDWVFGGGRADLIDGDEKIAQNVVTRLKSFKNDWFLDVEANIDWFTILGSRSNTQTIVNETYRVTQGTEGVWKVTDVSVATSGRDANISVSFVTVNSNEYTREIVL